MKRRVVLTAWVTLAGSAMLVGQLSADANARGGSKGGVAGVIGQDIIPGDLTGPFMWGGSGGIGAYSIGTTSCNIGDVTLSWVPSPSSPNHPVMPQNMYRYEMVGSVSTMKQLGLSWLKHAFCAFQQTLCGACTSCGGGCPTCLGPGCSDPYTAQRNGGQSTLGPRWEVNATTGVWPNPYSTQGQTGSVLFKRLQVANSDIDPALHPGAIFYGEAEYLHPQDAANGNGLNNASHRRLNVGAFTGTQWSMSFTSSTVRMIPAIDEWKTHDPTVTLQNVDVTGDGRYRVAYDVTDIGGGLHRYEYAIFNINSHRAAESFAIPLPAGVAITNMTFSGPQYHSGEPPNNLPWTQTTSGGFVKWATEAYDGGGANQHSAYALRFATTYNFGFTANAAPVDAAAVLDLFRPGLPSTVSFTVKGPGGAAGCASDVDDSGCTNGIDLAAVLAAWTGDATYSPCPPFASADLNQDCKVNGLDLGSLLGGWGPCAGGICP